MYAPHSVFPSLVNGIVYGEGSAPHKTTARDEASEKALKRFQAESQRK